MSQPVRVSNKSEPSARGSYQNRYTQEDLDLAVKAVRVHRLSYRAAAQLYEVPVTTLKDTVSGKTPMAARSGSDSYLTYEEEAVISRWITNMIEIGYRLTRNEIRLTVKKMLDREHRPNPFKDNCPGIKWMHRFLQRHLDVSIKTIESLGRDRGISQRNIRKWFGGVRIFFEDEVADGLEIFDDPQRVFNADAIGFPLAPDEAEARDDIKVPSETDADSMSDVNGSPKKQITALCCINAAGFFLPAMLIFPQTAPSSDSFLGMPEGTFIETSQTGWVDGELFYKFLTNHFYQKVKQLKVEFPVVLFINGYTTHVTLEAADFCSEHQIVLYCILPHASHLIQPCNISFFSLLINQWKLGCQQWRMQHPGEVVTRKTFPAVFSTAWAAACDPNAAINGFRDSGLYPLDPEAIDKTKLCLDSIQTSHNTVSVGVQTDITIKPLDSHKQDVVLTKSYITDIPADQSTREAKPFISSPTLDQPFGSCVRDSQSLPECAQICPSRTCSSLNPNLELTVPIKTENISSSTKATCRYPSVEFSPHKFNSQHETKSESLSSQNITNTKKRKKQFSCEILQKNGKRPKNIHHNLKGTSDTLMSLTKQSRPETCNPDSGWVEPTNNQVSLPKSLEIAQCEDSVLKSEDTTQGEDNCDMDTRNSTDGEHDSAQCEDSDQDSGDTTESSENEQGSGDTTSSSDNEQDCVQTAYQDNNQVSVISANNVDGVERCVENAQCEESEQDSADSIDSSDGEQISANNVDGVETGQCEESEQDSSDDDQDSVKATKCVLQTSKYEDNDEDSVGTVNNIEGVESPEYEESDHDSVTSSDFNKDFVKTTTKSADSDRESVATSASSDGDQPDIVTNAKCEDSDSEQDSDQTSNDASYGSDAEEPSDIRDSRKTVQSDDDSIDTETCHNCGLSEDETAWVGCDQCPRWFHLSCTNLDGTSEEDLLDIDFNCGFC